MKKIVLALSLFVLFGFSVSACKKGGASTPEQALKAMIEEAKKENWGAIYDSISKDSVTKMEKMMKDMLNMFVQMAKMNPEAAKNPEFQKMMELVNTNGKDFFIKLATIKPEDTKKFVASLNDIQILKSDIQGDKATLTVKAEDKEETVDFIKEDGVWKLDLSKQLEKSVGGEK